MKLYVKCVRCQGDLEIDTQTVKNADALGDDLVLEHAPGQCVNDTRAADAAPEPLRRYRAQILIIELPPPGDERYADRGVNEEDVVKGFGVHFPDPQLATPEGLGTLALESLIGVGKTVEARNAGEAVNGPLTAWLNEAWPKVMENAAFADVPAAQPTTPQT